MSTDSDGRRFINGLARFDAAHNGRALVFDRALVAAYRDRQDRPGMPVWEVRAELVRTNRDGDNDAVFLN